MSRNETHQKAITRVAQWLDLSKEKEREFIDIAHEVSKTQDGDYVQFDEKYLEYLQQSVFTHNSIIQFLERSTVDSMVIEQFESQNIPFDKVYQSWKEIRYSTNEILDLTMLLKLIHRCSNQSDSDAVDSRYKLQKLVYLVNNTLVAQERIDRETAPYDHGKLEKTGFRYSYRKRISGPFSKDLEEDKHRLYASHLIDEKPVEDSSSPEINERNVRYEISLGASGRVMMRRFSSLLEELQTDVLSEWEHAINSIVAEFGSMSIEQLHDHVMHIEEIEQANDRKLLIRGRRVKYDSDLLEASAKGGVGHV